MTPRVQPAQPTLRPIERLFTPATEALWATTYSLDLGLINEFLLPRLGDPPLNIAVLADQRRMAADLARIPAGRSGAVAKVNSRWLLRGIPSRGAFHPKSYLALSRRGATLLVGSGNLTLNGLDSGKEVFTSFRSGTPIGDAALAAWRSWMRRLVAQTGDTVLAERYRRLEAGLPAVGDPGIALPSPLLHNLDTSIARQLTDVVARTGGRVKRLWLTAPYYDADAAAVGALLDALRPERVKLFVAPSTSVDGARLAERLQASGARVSVIAYEPDTFVHAKLIGVEGKERGWLLSGSANLSSAALCRRAEQGNTELAVLAPADPDQLRAVFMSLDGTKQDLGSLFALSFSTGPDPEPKPLRLLSAAVQPDGRIVIRTEPSVADGWSLSDLAQRQPLVEDGQRATTTGPLAGRLVEVVDSCGTPLSDRLVVDDPLTLEETLTYTASASGPALPAELDAAMQESFLGREFLRLHRTLILDASEVISHTGRGRAGAEEVPTGGDLGDDDFWERLKREELGRDPRAGIYERILGREALGGTEPLVDLLEALRLRTPGTLEETSRVTAFTEDSFLERLLEEPSEGNGGQQEPAEETEDGVRSVSHTWSPSARIRVRARNLLRRWVMAQSDPRLAWIDPLAPAVNFTVLTATLARIRLEAARCPGTVELTTEDLDEVWELLLRSFVGTGRGDGWLERLDAVDRAAAQDRVSEWLDLPETVAALCWLAVRPGHTGRAQKVAFQRVLVATLGHGLLKPTKRSGRYLSRVTGRRVRRRDVDERLCEVMEFMDDELWCDGLAEDLGLEGLALDTPPGSSDIRVRVRGATDPLSDSRVPRLILAVRQYRRRDGVALFDDGEGNWRLSFRTGETLAYLPGFGATGRGHAETAFLLSEGDLERLCATGGVLADWFAADNARAAVEERE